MSNKEIIENWYEEIKEYTFETFFLPITVSEATIIVKGYEKKKLSIEEEETEFQVKIFNN
jgi:hypothetical protein